MISTLPAAETLLNVARGHSWVTETAGPNRGEVVDHIIRTTGLDPARPPAPLRSIPWCAAFVAYIGQLALRERWPLKPWAGCAQLGDQAEQLGLLYSLPAPGAVFLLWSESAHRFRHTGFVVANPTQDRYTTVEGNTSPDGSPEGTGVFLRERTVGPRDRFIWWWLAP